MKKILMLVFTFALPGYQLAFAQPVLSGHLHRLIGLAAKSAMMQASVLYHESALDKNMDRGFAKQNADEITRLVRSQISNIRTLDRYPGEKESVSREVSDMSFLAGRAAMEADSLLAAVSSKEGSQLEIRKRTQILFHIERQMLGIHQSVEAVIGIKPPPDPPVPQ